MGINPGSTKFSHRRHIALGEWSIGFCLVFPFCAHLVQIRRWRAVWRRSPKDKATRCRGILH
jgi:hypothetical protein